MKKYLSQLHHNNEYQSIAMNTIVAAKAVACSSGGGDRDSATASNGGGDGYRGSN